MSEMAGERLQRRGYLGIEVEVRESPVANRPENSRLVVSEVEAGGPAARAGVSLGDELIAINGRPIENLPRMRATAARLLPHQPAELLLLRDGHELKVQVCVGGMPLETILGGRVVLDEVPWTTPAGDRVRLRAIWTLPDVAAPHPAPTAAVPPAVRSAAARPAGPAPHCAGPPSHSAPSHSAPQQPAQPHASSPDTIGAHPVVWLLPSATWVSEDHAVSTWHPTYKLVQGLTAAGFATLRVERSGLGDSEGPLCTELDLHAELGGFRSALEHFQAQNALRKNALFLFGRSLGGVLAPLLAQDQDLAGVVVWGTSARPWHEAMLKSSARQYALSGLRGPELQRTLERLCELQELIYLEKLSPAAAYERRPDLRNVSPKEVSGSHVYGRAFEFFQQLQDEDLTAAWQRVRCPVLAVHADCDFLTELDDLQQIAELTPRGRLLQLHRIDHFMHERASLLEAFRTPWGGKFSSRAVQEIVSFLRSVS